MDLDYFKLIDRIVDLNLGERTIVVEAQVPEKHTIFEGHFPGFPIMPGVLLTEAMAQSSGWLLLGVLKFERMPFLAIVKEAKMRGFVSPGQLLTIEAKVEHEGSGFAVTKAKGRIGKELKCSAEITFGLTPFPDPAFRVHMDAMAEKIGFPMQVLKHD
ncbi:beta-hydroxyacyl-ACP dehydratase [Bradyrhizobium sp. AUGA SZCCT0240]|jgi:3-hydroxyacyl-[acyl-carrier-protein] dehydratase|uniref:3-hydroxyacyl-ACP dehydratase FabZ family protein n=1 Tax=unclassified Bradyrhizobium TaxID=2631580 RepID=UPI00178B5A4B|nr:MULTISPECIES: 3-hydroxyacyl-ACP dehydratase FabZ family protein [unclassified Bradyrhizobium]MBR1193283.1 beta-hydroxyacyl-ACP dehydratase [Bradyrhizobium sp. AUGA SZCCT0160]MBR1195790.1 beta-hydroxyacyl-ACP dehydratase [Bradyrhizobium sp. AUGA SZCCT0158]MBR1240189.1 beta-hydroxyacyl-ACP dehydratase [Bradyrhizobium sp. AUGA SZCCT0274]MBR1250926.1 beta-hydroxyacyl-ACP dehydratase [Bradyrhizobium sp. AUGA SZCCT0169]MBR1256290.1 beta-hydroxyacyl-ACP dehydratase [Bradyrhizobium sp. AUGA SZCCT02